MAIANKQKKIFSKIRKNIICQSIPIIDENSKEGRVYVTRLSTFVCLFCDEFVWSVMNPALNTV